MVGTWINGERDNRGSVDIACMMWVVGVVFIEVSESHLMLKSL